MKRNTDYYKQFKKIVIVGGSSGIGFCLAKELLDESNEISLISRSQEKLELARNSLIREKKGTKVHCFPANVANQTDIETALKKAIETMAGIDLLIITAGIAHPGMAAQLEVPLYQSAITVNYLGSVYCVQYCLPFLRQNQCAKILLTSSVAGLIAIYGYSTYSPTKSAISMYGQILQQELAGTTVSLSILYPPDTNTEQLHYEERLKPEVTRIITKNGGFWQPEQVAIYTLKKLKKNNINPGFASKMIRLFSSLIAPMFKKYTRILIWSNKASRLTSTDKTSG
ncbi:MULTISPECIES: SDR family NAD(P)-dependent oxidoreductase [unclassified Legionella]|uniref:SDR family NAD(P)-dependent oxidoreductase n=1 Tax=unclassified Legionella TaxID=2622702 RepID=UPI00105590CD|nr:MULTISPECIES: SDR family NAD(P)-dependent oxidoreductase [unclassified Legionella]MDI9819341.1 SDR family NAD(P)-dependent oxidoreductase [Legionella sp. PL877]